MSLQTEQLLNGRYRLEEPIGYGGMGRVFRAIDELLDRPVAVKLLDRTGDADTPELSEARAAARLSHPGVVHVFDVGVSDPEGQGYIVMELVPGSPLAEILRERGRLPPKEAAELAGQVADALEAIHRHGMVHCDVKPLNIIVTPSGHAKLVDFGIARATAADGENLGSAAYVAPEQARGETVDARTDIYALGAVLYEMLVGNRPFSGANTAELVRKRLISDPPPPRTQNPRVPGDLEAIVMRALAREPAKRYTSAAELRDALHQIQSRAAAPTQVMPRVRLPARLIPSKLPYLKLPHVKLPQSKLPQSKLPHVRRPYACERLPEVREFPRPRRAIATAAAIAICAVAVAGWRVTHPQSGRVPNLVGLPLSQVSLALEQGGVAPADVTVLTREVDQRYVGTVVDQQPQPGLPRSADVEIQIAVGVGH